MSDGGEGSALAAPLRLSQLSTPGASQATLYRSALSRNQHRGESAQADLLPANGSSWRDRKANNGAGIPHTHLFEFPRLMTV